MSDIMKLAAMLPDGVHWGDTLTPEIARAVAEAAVKDAVDGEFWGLYDPVTNEAFKVDGHSALTQEVTDRCIPLYTRPQASAAVPDGKEPDAWCWVLDGNPTTPPFYGKGPDDDIIRLAAARDNPVTVRYFYTAPPAPPVPEQASAAVPERQQAIDLLVELARRVLRAMDDSEERDGDEGREHVLNAQDFDDVCETLDALDELPDGPDAGLVCSGPMKAAAMLAASQPEVKS